jgi:hypothetical protein
MGANEVSKAIHRQVVINVHRPPNTIDEELDYVLPTRVIDWIPKLVLRVDLARDYAALILHLQLIMSCHSQTRKDRAISYLPLLNFIASNPCCHVRASVNIELRIHILMRPHPLAKVLLLLHTQWKEPVRVLISLARKYAKARYIRTSYLVMPLSGDHTSNLPPLTREPASMIVFSF